VQIFRLRGLDVDFEPTLSKRHRILETRRATREASMNRKSDSPQEKGAPEDWSWLEAIIGTFSNDFLADGREQPPMQKRPELDELG
jgi:hypothetical protein